MQKTTLKPEDLQMKYSDIAFKGRDLRIFNGRGAVSVWDKTVTGLQSLRFPPFCLDEYRFSLAFREKKCDLLIQDIMGDMSDYMNRTGGPDGRGPHPLGTNWEKYVKDEKPGFSVTNHIHQTLLFQDGTWQPGQMERIGHYNKYFDGNRISFSAKTLSAVSAEKDEIFMQLLLTNRDDNELCLKILPIQNIIDPYHLNTYKEVLRPDSFTTIYDNPDCGKMYFYISADTENNDDGWDICLQPGEERTITFSVQFGFLEQVIDIYDKTVKDRFSSAQNAVCKRLETATANLPEIETDNELFDSFYKRSLLTVLESTWHRDDYIIDPFYSCGTWMYTLAWDTSFSSKILALTQPEGLRKAIKLYLESDVMRRTYLHCLGGAAEKPYVQTIFAAVKIVEDYILITQDRDFLNKKLKNGVVLDLIKEAYKNLFDRFESEDGLLDFGTASGEIIEIRTDGYRNKVSGVNGIAAMYLLVVANWCKERGDSDADELFKKAEKISYKMNEKMWSDREKWFNCIYTDETPQTIFSYHLFDFFASPLLSEKQRTAMASHICDGEFLGKYGMYSISKKDTLHYDYEDADWGGGGQYIGMPGRIAESMFLTGYGDTAWEILSRIINWSSAYPYFPQEIYTERLDNPDYEMPLEISAGAGIEAILFGVFGIRPQNSGELHISPCYNKILGTAKLTGFKFNNVNYDITLLPEGYLINRDNNEPKLYKYTDTAIFC